MNLFDGLKDLQTGNLLEDVGMFGMPGLAVPLMAQEAMSTLQKGQSGKQTSPSGQGFGKEFGQFFSEMKNFAEEIKAIFEPELAALFKDFLQFGESMLGIDPKNMKQFAMSNTKATSPAQGPENDSAPSPTK